MVGGILGSTRRRCARGWSYSLVSGLALMPWVPTVAGTTEETIAWANSGPALRAGDCPPNPDERSVVVAAGKAPADDAGVAVATDQASSPPLEPVANTSDHEPELADSSAAASSPEPTPADSPTAAIEPTPTDEPTQANTQAASPSVAGAYEEENCVEQPVHARVATKPAAKTPTPSFAGVTPGLSTRANVVLMWGEPFAKAKNGSSATYDLPGFAAVKLQFDSGIVKSIHVELSSPTTVEKLVAKLGLKGLRAAVATDDEGRIVSTAYPERGVTLSHRPAGDVLATDDESAAGKTAASSVHAIIIRAVEAGPFVLRAQTAAARDYGHKIADLESALALDGKSAEVRIELSALKLATGQAIEAEQLAAEAVELASRNDAYRLHWAKCLKYLARYDEAVKQVRVVLEGTTASQIVRAQALEQMGLLAALGSKDVQSHAVALHNKAIGIADPLTTSADASERAAASQLLVAAHLALAEQIAAGDFQDKSQSVEKWITRASGIAEHMIQSGESDVSPRLQVAVSALVAGGRLNPPINPEPWIKEAEQTVGELQKTIDDRQAREELNWQLGLAYYFAAEIQHRRGEAESALNFGTLAEATLAPLAATRSELPDTQYVLGRLYFQIGAVYAVHRHDHVTACQWYDRAIEPLSCPAPVTTLAGPSQHGDALISMGVSYWETGERDRAFELTKAGMEMIKQGVDQKLLDASALKVPQNNLASMSRAMGKDATIASDNSADDDQQVAQSDKTSTKQTSRADAQSPSQTRAADRRSSAGSSVRRR